MSQISQTLKTPPKLDKAAQLGTIQKSYKKSHFSFAFLSLSSDRKQALSLLYEVCRRVDDAVDEPKFKDPKPYLNSWMETFLTKSPRSLTAFGEEKLGQDFLDMAAAYDLPLNVMVDLIDKGVLSDLNQNRYESPMDTEAYCYGVAGTVGIACLPIFGVPYQEAKDFAVRLGITVQWINLIRDVGVDAKLGRIYLPLDHLDQFGYTEADLLNEVNNQKFRELMAFEASVARNHFKRVLELFPQKWFKELLPARIMARIYLELLAKIEKNNFNVFKSKIRLNILEKGLASFKEMRIKEW